MPALNETKKDNESSVKDRPILRCSDDWRKNIARFRVFLGRRIMIAAVLGEQVEDQGVEADDCW